MLAFPRFLAASAFFLTSTTTVLANDPLLVTELAPDLLMLSADRGSYSDNSLVFSGPDGVLLVDTQHADNGEALKRFVENLGMGHPKYIISTHRHVEHIGGNTLFGAAPILVAHQRFPGKLRSGSALFVEYPPEAFPDMTFSDTLEIRFNGELIRLTTIGGSHDDNEIMVHFTRHGVAHVSSVVNGFNFPSVDSDGNALQFEPLVHRLMKLLPRDTRLVSGHHGKQAGFATLGRWDQLPAYAKMMADSVRIVRQQLDDGKTLQEMTDNGVLSTYDYYAGSYVSTDAWTETLVDTLSKSPPGGDDVYKPLFENWKSAGAGASARLYREFLEDDQDRYGLDEFVLLNIGATLQSRQNHEDAVVFLRASTQLYPDSEYDYYTHYLAALSLHELDQLQEALSELRKSLALNPEFKQAQRKLEAWSGERTRSTLPAGAYFGQEPPGLVPKKFAPGFISTPEAYELNSIFTADGQEFYWALSTTTPEEKAEGHYFYKVMYSRLEDEHWTAPRQAPFSGEFSTVDIAFSPDAGRLYFCTDRSDFEASEGLDIWYVERNGSAWSEPVDVGPPVNSPAGETQPSFTRDGTLYFPSLRGDSDNVDIYYAEPEGDSFAEPVRLGPGVNSRYNEGNSFVSPDGDYLLFARWGMPPDATPGNGMYISFKDEDGHWTEARHVEEQTGMCGSLAALSPDGRYLFYSCDGDIYWVDAKIIDRLR